MFQTQNFASSRAAFWGLIAIKIILGLFFIDSFSIDLDEPFSIFHAQKEWHALNQIFVEENNPPLHFWLLHFWLKLFGISPVAVRSLSLVFSVLTLIVLYKLTCKLLDDKAAFWVSLCFLFSNYHHYHGLEARGYALFVLLFTTLLFVIEINRKSNSVLQPVLIGSLLAGLFLTHYMSLLILAPIGIYWLWLNRNKKRQVLFSQLAIILGTFSLIASLQIQNLILRISHVSNSGTWVRKPHWTEFYGLINKFLNGPQVLIAIALLILLAVFKKYLNFKNIRNSLFNSSVSPLFFLIFGIYSLAFIVSLVSNNAVFLDRYLFFLSIGIFIIMVAFLEFLKPLLSYWSLLPLVAFILGFNPLKTNNRASDEMAVYAKSFKGTILISPPHFDLTFTYHYDRSLFEKIKSGKELFPYHIYPVYDLVEVDLNKCRKPLVLIDAGSEFLYGNRKLLHQLQQIGTIRERRAFPGEYEVVVFD